MTTTRRRANTAKAKQDHRIEQIYYQHCAGVQISLLDIGSIFAAGRAALAAGGDEAAVTAAILARVQEVRVN